MNKNFLCGLFLFASLLFLQSCNTTTPEKYFDIAVLNTNLIFGFASERLSSELESPSAKLTDNGGTAPMKRSEIIRFKIKTIEENYDEVKDLKETTETKDMIEASLAMYKFVLPVYKTEYTQLANLYDNNAPRDQIESLTKLIHDKYFPKYDELYNKLIEEGKAYAEKNNIKVNWGVY